MRKQQTGSKRFSFAPPPLHLMPHSISQKSTMENNCSVLNDVTEITEPRTTVAYLIVFNDVNEITENIEY